MDYDKEVSTDRTCECGAKMELTFRKDGIFWVCTACDKEDRIR